MRALFLPIVLLLLSAAATPAAASVFKCSGDKGAVVYQDVPCSPGRELRNFDTDPPPLSVLPGTAVATVPPVAKVPGEPSVKTIRDRARPQGGDAKAAERKFVRSGMREAEVVQRIGRPDVSSRGGKSGRRWAYLPTPGDPGTMTTLTLQGGSVVDVERKLVR